jgi:hypothetical protein
VRRHATVPVVVKRVPGSALSDDSVAVSGAGPNAVSGRLARPSAAPLAALISIVAAGALELGLRMEPSYDPFGWLVWGRQTIHLALDPAGAPSWKPLPWLLTTPLALAGGAAPTLWLIVACAAGLWALWLAYRLGHRLAGPVGGAAAVAALLLCRNWFDYLLTGNVEPATAALALGAVESHVLGRRRLAFVLLGLTALLRPEAGLVLVAYGLWLWRSDRGARAFEAAFAAALALLWFLPPYIATGVGFGSHDPVFVTSGATHDPLTVVYRAGVIVIWPVAIAALAGLAFAVRSRPADRGLALAIAGGSAGWVAATALMAAVGFPGLQRFMLPAGAGICVIAGAGVGWAVAPVRGLLRSRRWPLGSAILLLTAAATVWYAHFRIIDVFSSVRSEQARSSLDRSLNAAIAAAGGRRRLLACGLPSADLGFQSVLGWDLHRAVGQILFHPRRDVHRPDPVVLLATNRLTRLGRGGVLLSRAGPWRVIAIRPPPACAATGPAR